MKVAIVKNEFGTAVNMQRMLNYLGHEAELVSDPTEVLDFSHLILPGVGSFSHASQRLWTSGFADAIIEFAALGRPVLGVCLGMQLLGTGSSEGSGSGLGLMNFESHALASSQEVRAHLGWSEVSWRQGRYRSKGQTYFYFNHSYGVPVSSSFCGGVSVFEDAFASVVNHENILGVQFHPEKSHRFGFEFLDFFALEFSR